MNHINQSRTLEMINDEKQAAQRSELATSPELWQFDLLTPEKLYQFSNDRAVPVLNSDTIKDLWCTGLLRSDLVRSSKRLEIPSVEFISEGNGFYTYCDKRTVEHRAQGYGGSIGNKPAEFDSVELLFHPFRLYVLYHVDRVFHSHSTSIQYFLNPEGMTTVLEHTIDFFNRWTAGKEFAERFEHWNRVAELARILDSTRETCRDFLTSMGLDYGVKVRCYVEGETELGALVSAVGEAGGTEFINLRGQVVEKRGKGLSFATSLKNELLQRVGKSETWGEALMKYALQHPEFPWGHKKSGEIRPAIEVARLLINARNAGYVRSIEKYKVDPATGELFKKD